MPGRSDVPLTTASGRPTSILRVLEEMRVRWAHVEETRNRARAMERYVYGRMTSWRGYALENQINLRTSLYAPPITKNKVKKSLLSWVARTVGPGLTTLVYPKDSTDEEIARADVANAVLDWQRQTQDRDALLYRAVLLAGMHGTSALYQTWDPESGPHDEREPLLDASGLLPQRDPAGNVIYTPVKGKGAPRVEALSVFDFITDGQKDVAHDGKWLAVRRWIDPDEASARLRAAGIPRDATALPVQNRQAHGGTFDAVEGWEMWWRPGATSRFPEGFFACVIDGDVTEATTFPYGHGKLPLAVIRVMDVEDDFFGATWVEDAVPQQIGLNHSLRVLAHRAEIAGQMRRLAYGPAHEAWDDSPDGCIDVKDAAGLQSVAFPEVPDIPKDMFAMCDRYEQGVGDVAGISDVASSGEAAAQTKNARLVYNATQVDQLGDAMTIKNLSEAVVECDTQILELSRQFIARQRLFTIVGPDNAVSADYFSGNEIGGNVRMEVASSTERSPAQKGADAEQDVMQGFLPMAKGAELRQTGLEQTADETDQRNRLQALIQQAAQGAAVQADMSIQPEVAIPDLRRALVEMSSMGPKATMGIRALLHEYEEMRTQAGAAQGQPQPGSGAPAGPQAQQQNQGPAGPQAPQPLVH